MFIVYANDIPTKADQINNDSYIFIDEWSKRGIVKGLIDNKLIDDKSRIIQFVISKLVLVDTVAFIIGDLILTKIEDPEIVNKLIKFTNKSIAFRYGSINRFMENDLEKTIKKLPYLDSAANKFLLGATYEGHSWYIDKLDNQSELLIHTHLAGTEGDNAHVSLIAIADRNEFDKSDYPLFDGFIIPEEHYANLSFITSSWTHNPLLSVGQHIHMVFSDTSDISKECGKDVSFSIKFRTESHIE
jgi:hypothetical protein